MAIFSALVILVFILFFCFVCGSKRDFGMIIGLEKDDNYKVAPFLLFVFLGEEGVVSP
jgi:hypothetical protein